MFTQSIDSPFGLKPEIEYQFKPESPRASPTTSTVFTYLVLSPLVILLLGWLKIGLSYNGIPGGLALPSSFLFVGGIGSICYILYKFWLELNMFEAIYYISLALVPTLVVGYVALRGIAMKRLEA